MYPSEPQQPVRQSRRSKPWVAPVVTFATIMCVGLGAISLWWHHDTGTWWFSISATPQGLATTAPRLTAAPQSPSAPQQPAAASAPEVRQNPVPQGVPTSLTVRRGAGVVIPSAAIGQYEATSDGVIDPPGNGPVWINNLGSQVGAGMGTAWIVGHTEMGNAAMPFNKLDMLQQGDLIDVMVGDQQVTFIVDSVGPPPPTDAEHQGLINLTNDELNTVKLITCTKAGDTNIVVSAHAISL